MTRTSNGILPSFFERDLIAEAARYALEQEQEAKKLYTEDDLAQAKAEAFERGRQEAEQSLLVQQNENLINANRSLALLVSDLLSQVDQTRAHLINEIVDVALLAVRSMAGAALEALPDAELLAMIQGLFNEIRDESRLEVSGHFDHIEPLKCKLDEALSDIGFSGRLVINHEPRADLGNCRLAWGKGGLDLNQQAIDQQITAIFDQLKYRLSVQGHVPSDSHSDEPKQNQDVPSASEAVSDFSPELVEEANP